MPTGQVERIEQPMWHGPLHYACPRIDPRFSSPLLRVENFDLGASGDWQARLSSVVTGRKPIVFIDTGNPDTSVQIRDALFECGLPHLSRRHEFSSGGQVRFFSLARPGRIEDDLDVDALIADYRAWFAHAPEVLDAIVEDLTRVRGDEWEQWLRFSDVEADYRVPHTYARAGLLFGYDHRTTAALIGARAGLSGFSTTLT